LLELREALDGEAPAEAADRIRADGDRRSHELIMEALAAVRPDDPVLSEEGKLEPARLDSSRVWIVDPLDGTREFGEPGRTDWAVHVALTVDGDPVAGAVALPACGMTLATEPAPPPPVPPPRRPRVVVSRSRAPELCFEVARRIDAEVVPMGSAGAKTMAVVLGEVDVYLHAGGQYEWDSAAPVAVAAACGLHTSRLDGSRLRYNNPDPWLPDLLVCRPDLADEVLTAAADIGGF
jgi:3'(2'), 5'-bisphosphate nucleotidase